MKRFTVVVAVLLIASAGAVLADVVGSKHDLTSTANTYYQTDTDQVCVFCHTPHDSAGNTTGPLWNHEVSTASYAGYTSSTIDMTTGDPGNGSIACLSCHDGTVALDVLVNEPGSGLDTIGSWTWNGGNNVLNSGAAYLGTDLSNDHPIGITYDTTADTAFNATASVTGAGLRFYGGKVECASCHDPHVTTYGTFLRIDNAASAVCTACHIK